MLRARDLLTVILSSAVLALAAPPLLDAAGPAWAATVATDRPILSSQVPLPAGIANIDAAQVTLPAVTSVTLKFADGAAAERRPEERRAVQSPAPALPATGIVRMRVGCEGAISALAGQEARRLLPSRCLS